MARAEELIRLLDLAHKFIDGNPERSHIDGLQHSLRVATLARRWASGGTTQSLSKQVFVDQISFMGLVHDLARPLSDPYHGEVIAEIVRDMIPGEMYQVLRTHGTYQAAIVHDDDSYISTEEEPWHYLAVAMAAWEEASFRQDWQIFPVMTKTEAVTLIYKICAGRD